jgi:hypothetical protein
MIKFFRKIRQNLLTEGKTSKYFKYAIGEIVLVVIGILIALQINNWNENRKVRKDTYTLSIRLLNEVNKNIKSLEVSVKELKSVDNATLTTLDLITEDFKVVNASILDSLIYKIIITPNSKFYTSVLNEALATGKVSLFENDTLKQTIYEISTIIEEVEIAEKGIYTDINENLVPFFYDNISLRAVDSKFSEFASKISESKLKPLDNRVILSNRKFENILDNKYFLSQLLNNKFKQAYFQFIQLKNLLENELQKSE